MKYLLPALALLFAFGFTLTCLEPDDSPLYVEAEEIEESRPYEVVETPELLPDVPPEEPEQPPPDPYAGHETWCEELQPPPCATNEECSDSQIGVPRRCITPFWYEPEEDEKAGLCIPVYLGRTPKQERDEMNRRKARLLQIVKDRCSLPTWAENLHAQYGYIDCGRVPGRSRNMITCIEHSYCDPYKLDAALRVVAKREADWRSKKVHRLKPDVEASADSWLRHCARGTYKGNPHFGDCYPTRNKGKKTRWRAFGKKWKRWRTYGLYGMNASLWVMMIDLMAPPEILCHEVYATEGYLRKMRQAWRRYDKGIDCRDAEGKLYRPKLIIAKKQKRDRVLDTWPEKTWYTLHRAASSGSLCPHDKRPENEGVKTKRYYYSKRMEKVGMDPDEIVTLEMLGEKIPQDQLHAHVQALMARLDAEYPPP